MAAVFLFRLVLVFHVGNLFRQCSVDVSQIFTVTFVCVTLVLYPASLLLGQIRSSAAEQESSGLLLKTGANAASVMKEMDTITQTPVALMQSGRLCGFEKLLEGEIGHFPCRSYVF